MEINSPTVAALNSVATTSTQATNSTSSAETASQPAPVDSVTISSEAQRLLAAEQQSSGGTYTPANTGLEPPPPTRPKQEH